MSMESYYASIACFIPYITYVYLYLFKNISCLFHMANAV